MSKTEDHIRRCYCGSPVATLYQLAGMKELWFVSCPQCRIRTRYFNTEESAIEEWNARPEASVREE